jgi:glycosyltransferase involved in cell wall biosynthesis
LRKLFINGLSAKAGGGKSILDNYLTLLSKHSEDVKYFVLTPDPIKYQKFSSNMIEIVAIKKIFQSQILVPLIYKIYLPHLIRKINPDVIFNLADIPISIKTVRQVFLFDWPYAAYRDSIVWKRMDFLSWIKKKIKLHYFVRFLDSIDTTIVQTDTIKRRLESLYPLKDIVVIPNAVTLEHNRNAKDFDFGLPNAPLLLCLSRYYPHKNLEILLPLAKEIKLMSLDFKLVITINSIEHKMAKVFLSKVTDLELDDVILNIGPVDMDLTPALYQKCDALLMPTLLETYCLPYIEAMKHRRVILTSDMDFSRDVCGESAVYFDPLNHLSILESIQAVFSSTKLRKQTVDAGTERLKNLNSWEEVVQKYNFLLEDKVNYD